jgi:uncharacterized protein
MGGVTTPPATQFPPPPRIGYDASNPFALPGAAGRRRVESFVVPHLRETPYTVSVIDIVHRPGEMREKSIDVTVDDEMGNAVIGVRTGAKLHIDARLESLHDGILVSGDVDVVAQGECVRCLIDVSIPVEVEFAELFAYSFDEAFDYTVQDDHVDLEPLVRDAVVLSLPFQPVCQEDCLGLCPECGVRLLDNPGHEHEAPVDPRWAALVGLDQLGDASNDVDGGLAAAEEEKS